ncbi:hypothetical protein Tco_1161309 [Tanacetum coccineum]
MNPLFDEEIISDKIDASIISSLKINSLLEQVSSELAHIDPIPPGIEKADFDLEEEIRLVENLSCDNSYPRPPEELNFEIADTILESLSLHLLSSSRINDDYDLERDIHSLEELLINDSLPLPENESSNLDHFNDPPSPRPPPEPSDVEISLIIETDAPVINNFDELNKDECFDPGGDEIDVVDNDSFTFVIRTFLQFLTYPVDSPFLYSFGSEDTIFDPGIST